MIRFSNSGSGKGVDRAFTTRITYFLQEGRDNLRECLNIAFAAAKQHNVGKIVIFTAKGEGVKLALDEFCSKPEFEGVSLVAVTFPQGKAFTDSKRRLIDVDISSDYSELFRSRGVPLVRAHLPFDPIAPPFKGRGVLGQDLSLVGDALNMFGGSMSLCVQAVVIACDAGAVKFGEHVIALTSDTAILAQATSTRRMLGEFVIREILCKPAVLSIGRKESADRVIGATSSTGKPELPAPQPPRKSETPAS